MHLVVNSPLGKAFLAVRENDVRASLIGLNVYVIRLTAFVMAGFLAGVAGALFAFFGRYASASYMFYTFSGEGRGLGYCRRRGARCSGLSSAPVSLLSSGKSYRRIGSITR